MLKIEGLHKHFGSLKAVDDFSLDVGKGTVHGLIGPNGSGKSTVLNLVSGFLTPTRGKIWCDGSMISGRAPHQIARAGVVRTFQLIKVYSEISVRDNIRVAAMIMGTHPRPFEHVDLGGTLDERVEEILKLMNLEDVAHRQASTLPGGLRRTLSVASAIVGAPKLVLLDEPFAGLNPTEKMSLASKLQQISGMGVTVVLVEHDLKTVIRLCSKVTVINFGKKIAEGNPHDVIAEAAVLKAYIGSGARSYA
jgi:ABC-type branched-subunit amino acid transport system ATPase component